MNTDPIAFDALTRVLTGLHEYTIVAAVDTPNSLTVRVIATATSAPCPACGEFSTALKAVRDQAVRDVPHAGRAVALIVVKRSFRCTADWCDRKTFTQHTDEIGVRRRTTARCREQIGRAGKDRSTASVAREFSVSWSTAWTAIQIVAVRELRRCGRRVPAVIGIDETRFWWREPWLTGIVDLSNSDLIEMVCGRSSHTLREWVAGLTDTERSGVTTVVIDLHAGYRAAISEVLPNAVIVGDRFHFEQLGGRAVTDVRRRRIWEQQAHRGRKIDPGWRARHDLLRHPDRLTVNGWARVVNAMRTDAGDSLEGELLWAWAARQYFGEIYATAVNRAHAHRMLIWWYCWIADHQVPELVRFATTVSAWETEFLAFFDQRVTNGRTEGRNRTIKHVKRLGYGYRSTRNYTLKCRYRALRLTSWTEPAKRPLAASIA
ncbi:MAG: ISL3 family transposase [Ilumatobacteraceae bacterium]|nr:ISL3 family transposase [Ilumatobacteraceae bacterium]